MMSGFVIKRRFDALPDILVCIASIGTSSQAAGFAVNTANAWQRK
jgi:hypothetical protein